MLFCEYFARDIYILSIQLLSSIWVNLSVCTKPFSFPNAWKVMLLMFGIFSFQWISIFRSNGKYEIFLTHLSKQILFSLYKLKKKLQQIIISTTRSSVGGTNAWGNLWAKTSSIILRMLLQFCSKLGLQYFFVWLYLLWDEIFD